MILQLILIVLILAVILIIPVQVTGSGLQVIQSRLHRNSLIAMILSFWLSLFLWILFDRSCADYQFIFYIDFWQNFFPCDLPYGVDGISLFFILLTTFISPLCLLTSWKKKFIQVKEFCLYFLLLEVFLILAFTALELISFFIFFESILIPMFFIIGIWGSRERRVRAAFFFFLYTMVGSIFLFFSMLILYYDAGTTSFCVLNKVQVSYDKQLLLWIFIFLAFSVKIPTIPFHIWLPEAHVEAPTSGSVILAGLLLKLGGYGFIRVLLPIFAKGTAFYLPLVDTLAMISIVYASLTTIRQVDLKRIIAYSSVAHMNVVVLGIFSGNIQGVAGSIFLMIAHGIVSSALFFLIGVVYDRYETRLLQYYGGLIQVMPVYGIMLMLFCMANVGLPGTCNFIGELVVFVGLIDRNFFVLIVAVSGVILSVLYTMFLFNRVVFGSLNNRYISIYKDMNKRENAIIEPLAILTIILGFFPDLIFDSILTSVSIVIEKAKIV